MSKESVPKREGNADEDGEEAAIVLGHDIVVLEGPIAEPTDRSKGQSRRGIDDAPRHES